MSEVERTRTLNPAIGQNDDKAVGGKQAALLDVFNRMLPIVDGMADSIRNTALLGVLLVAWVFVWLFFLRDFSLTTALWVAGIALLPLLILARFWWALEELKGLPDIVEDMMDDAKEEFHDTVQGIRAGDKQKMGLIGSMKNLWSVGSLEREAKELAGSYISIGTLMNPFMLILGVLSLLFVLLLILIGIVLAVMAL